MLNDFCFVGNIIKMKPTQIYLKILSFTYIIMLVSCHSVDGITSTTPSPTSPVNKTPTNQTVDDVQNDVKDQLDSEKIPNGLEIEFWHPWSGETDEMVKEIVDKFNRENSWSIVISSIPHANQDVLIKDLTDVFIDKEDIPDVVVSTSQSLQAWYAEGFPIIQLDPFIELDSVNSVEEILPEILPIFWNVDVVDGVRIGIPAYQSGEFLFYNKTWGNELGFDDFPETIEQFEEQACAAARNNLYDKDLENNGTGGLIYNNEGLLLLSWLRGFDGGELINSRSQPILTEPENIDALTFLYDLYLKDCAWTGRATYPYTYFSDRFALFYSGQMEDIIKQVKYESINEGTDDWTLIPYPSITGRPVVIIEGLSFAITTENEEKSSAAWKFIKWILRPENQAVFLEETGTFPLSSDVIEKMDVNTDIYTVWNDSLQYLPYAKTEPSFREWYILEKVLEDVGWQLIQYNTHSEDIETILNEAEVIVREIE